MRNHDYAYVTVLTNEKYLPGIWVLAYSLREAGNQYPLIVLLPEGQVELKKQLNDWEIPVEEAPSIKFSKELVQRLNENDYWNETFFKLRVAGLCQYEKIVLLDSDVLVLRSIDHLFQCPSGSAVEAGKSINPTWAGMNSGVLILEPSRKLESRLQQELEPSVIKRLEQGRRAGDQDVFQDVFLDWETREELHLPENYNVVAGYAGFLCRKFFKDGERDIYIVHFIGPRKPWDYRGMDYMRMLYHGFKQRNFAEWKAFCKYRKILRKQK